MIKKFGGDEENRTPDPLLARQVLSQLSYAPVSWLHFLSETHPVRYFSDVSYTFKTGSLCLYSMRLHISSIYEPTGGPKWT